MQHTFEVDTRRRVNTLGDYATVSYRARPTGEGRSFSGTVKVSPRDASPEEHIRRDLLEKIRWYRSVDTDTIQVTIEDGLP